MMKMLKLLIPLTVMAGFLACEEEVVQPEPGDVFAIEAVKTPAVVDVSRERDYALMFRISHPDGISAISGVKATLFQSNQTTQFREITLLDDGNTQNSGSGDVLAGDGVFSNVFQSDSLVFPRGSFFIRASVTDNSGETLTTGFAESRTIVNVAPEILTTNVPDTLQSGTAPIAFSITVLDSNLTDDIQYGLMRLQRNSVTLATDTLFTESANSDFEAVLTRNIDSTYAAERVGEYQLAFQVADASGDLSNVILQSIFLENTLPIVFNPSLPDSVTRPTVGTGVIEVRISADDSQGLGDLQIVNMTIQREGGTPSTIEMFDNGDFENYRDEVAGDGIFSRGLLIDGTSASGTFYFTFEAQDRVGNLSAALVDSLVILP